MTTERTNAREIIYHCDNCPDSFETETDDWSEALELLRAEGWLVMKVGDEWKHTCAVCSEELCNGR